MERLEQRVAAAHREPRAEAEIALEVGAGGEIAGYAAALELVDVARPPDDLESIVAANVFHRAFLQAPSVPEPPDPFAGWPSVNGAVHRPAARRMPPRRRSRSSRTTSRPPASGCFPATGSSPAR